MYNIWNNNITAWSAVLGNMNSHLNLLCNAFLEISNGNTSFEQVRNHWRSILHSQNPAEFPQGTVGISVTNLAHELFKINGPVTSSQQSCTGCEYVENFIDNYLGYVVHTNDSHAGSTNAWINALSYYTRRACPACRDVLQLHVF